MHKSGFFRSFDYGENKNLIHYESLQPPSYNIKNIKSPVALYYGESDSVTASKDVEKLAIELPDLVDKYFIAGYNHLDYLWSTDAPTILYKRVIALMAEYN